MKELQMINLQEHHITHLQEKLKEQKKKFIDKFISTPGWEEFLLKYSKTYFRPKGGSYTLKSATHGGKFGIVFPHGNADEVQFVIGYSGKGVNFRSSSIPTKEVEEFIELNKKNPEETTNESFAKKYNGWHFSTAVAYYEII